MKVHKARYLIKCEMPGCKNISKYMYSAIDEEGVKGVAICDQCVKAMSANIKSKKTIKIME